MLQYLFEINVKVSPQSNLLEKFWLFLRDIYSWVRNECCCLCTVNISNVNFINKSIWYSPYHGYYWWPGDAVSEGCSSHWHWHGLVKELNAAQYRCTAQYIMLNTTVIFKWMFISIIHSNLCLVTQCSYSQVCPRYLDEWLPLRLQGIPSALQVGKDLQVTTWWGRWEKNHTLPTHCIYIPGKLGFIILLLLCCLMMCTNNQVHYDPMVVFVCLHITLPYYHHYADLSEGMKLLQFLSGMLCWVCV